jgi:TonB-dependent SusC/RagA subfamily outer membrane receptor
MNPLYYWFANSARENIEFLADKQVLRSDNDPKAYQYALLKVAQNSSLPLTQHFSISHLKKRIIMMNKKRTHSLWTSKYLLVAPLLITTLLVVNAKELKDAWSNADFTSESKMEQETAVADSTKQVKQEVVIIKHSGDSARALILIDGKKSTEEEMQRLDPKTINKIEVFKDSMSVAKFGKDGKNGVMVITRKKNDETITATVNEDGNQTAVSCSSTGNGANSSVTTTVVTGKKGSKQSKTVIVRQTGGQDKPLFILDGKWIDYDINKIDPNDIESITVLKDSTAVKTYGTKGKNGVILIKSKKK